MKILSSLFFALIVWASFKVNIVNGQNEREFFKVYPAIIEESAPEWVVKMYDADPNVYEIEYLYQMYQSNNPWKKDIHVRNYLHWRKKVGQYLDESGYIRKPDRDIENLAYKALTSFDVTSKISRSTGVGPAPVLTFDRDGITPISMQANVYCIDISPHDKNLIAAGTESGGFFLSTDKGQSWKQYGADAHFNTVNAIKFHPEFETTLFLSGNRRIFRSDDLGNSWREILFTDADTYKILFHPRNHQRIFAATSKGFFRSEDGGDHWIKVFNEATWDIVCHPTQDYIWYLVKTTPDKKRSQFFSSEDGGVTWVDRNTGWYMPQNAAHAFDLGAKIGVTPADPKRVYVALIGESKPGDDGWIGVYRSNDYGNTWYLPSGQIGGPYHSANNMPWNLAAYSDGYHQGFYNFAIGVSHQNPDLLWIGTIRLCESRDGARTFISIGAAESQRHRHIHADIQDIRVDGQEIWICTDGGIDYSNDELLSHISLNNGLHASDFWGFDRGWNQVSWVGGKYHNGNSAYRINYKNLHFLHIGGVEEPTGYINPLDDRIVYTNQWWAENTRVQRIPLNLGDPIQELAPISIIPNESYVANSSSGIYFDPRYSHHLYIGSENALWKSEAGGSSFYKLHEFGQGEVHQISICQKFPNWMYLVFHEAGFWSPCRLYRTDDFGKTWVQVSHIPSDRWRLAIQVHPENPLHIWVAAPSGANGQKIFQSLDGGETWINRTQPILNNHRIQSIAVIPSGPESGEEDIIIIGTDRTIFTAKAGLEDQSIVPAGEGFPVSPNANTLKILPFYPAPGSPDLKVEDADELIKQPHILTPTYGRGLHIAPLEVPIRPVLQIMTHSDTVYCVRDTVTFSLHAILDNRIFTQVHWEFDPAPDFIQGEDSFQVKCIFGHPTDVKVSVQIESNDGQKVSLEYDHFVTILDHCSPTSGPGSAIQFHNPGDLIQLPPIDLQTNEFSFSAWILPEGIQAPYSGIFMNDTETAGLNFRENNELGYHWPGGAWWWSSGLRVPEDQWSHVALVATPDSISIYLNGQKATHRFRVPPVIFETAKLGSYKGWSSRNMRGKMDEVSLWNKALSQDEIRRLKHLIPKTDENGLWIYYQLNEKGNLAYDLVNNKNAQLGGNSERVDSYVPVGKGSVQKAFQLNEYVWEADSFNFTFSPGRMPANPENTWYIFKLDSILSQSENDDFYEVNEYWIINAYGQKPIQGTEDSAFIDFNKNHDQSASLASRELYREDSTWRLWSESESDSLKFYKNYLPVEDGLYWLNYKKSINTSTIKTQGLLSLDFVLFPNPAEAISSMQILFRGPVSGKMSIVDINGRIKWTHSFHQITECQIETSSLPTGKYILWVQTEDQMKSKLFEIIR